MKGKSGGHPLPRASAQAVASPGSPKSITCEGLATLRKFVHMITSLSDCAGMRGTARECAGLRGNARDCAGMRGMRWECGGTERNSWECAGNAVGLRGMRGNEQEKCRLITVDCDDSEHYSSRQRDFENGWMLYGGSQGDLVRFFRLSENASIIYALKRHLFLGFNPLRFKFLKAQSIIFCDFRR